MFLTQLRDNYRVIAKEKFAHDPRYPLNDNWENQVSELIDYVTHNKATGEKVIAMGHSFGALLSYMAVCRRPDIFSGLIMFDPPLITGLSRYLFRFAKKNRLIDRLTPAGITKYRKQHWESHHNLVDYFGKKTLFKNFNPVCLQDYIESVIEEQESSKSLSFDVETEANIFRTIPHNLPSYKGQLQVPAHIITGKHTDVCVAVLRNPFLKNNPNIQHLEFEKGGHMFPLEYPLELAAKVNGLLTENYD